MIQAPYSQHMGHYHQLKVDVDHFYIILPYIKVCHSSHLSIPFIVKIATYVCDIVRFFYFQYVNNLSVQAMYVT